MKNILIAKYWFTLITVLWCELDNAMEESENRIIPLPRIGVIFARAILWPLVLIGRIVYLIMLSIYEHRVLNVINNKEEA